MKVTKEQLKQIIKEELEEIMGEGYDDTRERQLGDEAQKKKLQKRIEKEKAAKEKAEKEEAGEKEPGMVKEEEQAVTEEQYFEILHRHDGFADAELLTKEQAEELLKPGAEFTHTHHSKGRYIAKVVRIADLER